MIDPTFQYRKLNEVGQRKSVEVAEAFTEILEKLRGICLRGTSHGGVEPNGREFALVRTKLEEASFFSKKCVAMLPENQYQTADVWLEEKQLVADAMKNSGRNDVLR